MGVVDIQTISSHWLKLATTLHSHHRQRTENKEQTTKNKEQRTMYNEQRTHEHMNTWTHEHMNTWTHEHPEASPRLKFMDPVFSSSQGGCQYGFRKILIFGTSYSLLWVSKNGNFRGSQSKCQDRGENAKQLLEWGVPKRGGVQQKQNFANSHSISHKINEI